MHENERAAGVAERVVEQAFLSPRVVDSATLAEFAESLGNLLRRAAEQREHLRLTVAEGERVAESLRETTGQATEKLRPALKLLPTIEHKLAQAEQAMSRAAEAAGAAERAADEAAKAASDKGVAALREAQRALDLAMERARGLEGRLDQLAERAQNAVQRLDAECKSRLDGAASHAKDILGTLAAELDERAEQVLERLGGLIEERRAAAEAALAEPLAVGRPGQGGEPGEGDDGDLGGGDPADNAAAPGLRAHMEETRAEIEGLFATLESRAREEIASLGGEIREAERRAAEATARVHETEELARAAEARLQAVRRELAAVDDRGREIAVMASQALAAFDEELTARMHAVREMMEQLASVTGSARTDPRATAPEAAEAKPSPEAAFVRIDRPMQSEAPGLPGRLRI